MVPSNEHQNDIGNYVGPHSRGLGFLLGVRIFDIRMVGWYCFEVYIGEIRHLFANAHELVRLIMSRSLVRPFSELLAPRSLFG